MTTGFTYDTLNWLVNRYHTIDSKWTIIQPIRTGNITITAPIQGSRNFGGTLTNLEIGSTYRVIAKADFMSSWAYWNAWTAGTTTASGNFIFGSLSRDFAPGDRLDAELQVQVDGTWHTIDTKWTIIQPIRTGNITITAPIHGSRNFGATLTNLEIGSTYRVIAKADFMSSWAYWNAWTAGTTTASGNFIAPLSRDFAPGDRLDAQLQVQVNGTWYTVDSDVVFVESPPQTNTPHGGSGMYYMRARWYDPTTARFITEDPIRAGMNWYIYCGNDPVNRIDPWGLAYQWIRDLASQIGGTVSWNENIGKATVSQGGNSYDYYVGDRYGSFIQNDLMYVNDKDFFSDFMLTIQDRQAGITITMVGTTPYKNVSTPLNRALNNVTTQAETIRANAHIVGITSSALWFIERVGHTRPWDIKRPDPWNMTIGAGTFPGFGIQVLYHGVLMTPEELGNYTYGYIGRALGFGIDMLYSGSWVAASFPNTPDAIANEYNDRISILSGFNAYSRRG